MRCRGKCVRFSINPKQETRNATSFPLGEENVILKDMLKPPYALPEISSDWLAAELDGHVDLGSRKEVTKLTRRILRHPRPTAAALWHAVRAIGTMHLPLRWRGDVESAFTRLTKREQRRANEAMLGYYYMIWEPELALQFCVIPRLQSAGEM